ncbi:site-specific DNA-methyltransferase [Nitrosomonas oligotropha]|uniref:site-specific DNA-methyltransferase (adenine-specific) n=1 Tax=Nitrosomonas oligotropha TaxID=42354 RepID=A0A1H8URE3_9PROT|nr:site-specific DNA-methyltransferase [Nitrosomonas oligotropha]SDX48277.1 adenine-specific DNA-methyltransferase [Nitrosomonas oligotropha]SEP05749.1 adenine-specific DNA-methyltransferase [Nitrosomonas oligotropha]
MTSKKQKLELTWIGKENRPKLEPRILLEDPAKSYHAKHRVSDNDIFDNRLIFGDNLLALKALEAEFAGKVKRVFIDPPYNTGSAFTHYDDGVEHSIWLSLMRDRLEIIRYLLAEDGSLWITIDDNEAHYLKVLCDEVFGRANFVATVIWQKKYAPKSDSKYFSESHDFVLVVAKQLDRFNLRRLPKTEKQTGRYTNRDNDPRGPWKASDVLRNEARDYAIFPVKLPSGREVMPPSGTSWRYTKEKFAELIADNRIWFGVDGDARPAYKRFLSEVTDTIPSTTIWTYDEVGHNDESKKEMRGIFGEDLFATPKPERLLERVLSLATNPNDLVLDSFAGSGTTGAVAHKMGRRWIMIELGEHCHTHIIPRLQKIIDGEDQGGISKAVNWQGGGGFRYYKLAPSLLRQDAYGQWIINKEYNAEMLAQALCKLEGFTYAPSGVHYWMHGYSTERDFLYVTTANLNHEQLQQLSDEVGSERSLLVLCTAFRGRGEYANLTVKKIPKQVLSRCEWGHDDYSLRVENLPKAPPPPQQVEKTKGHSAANSVQSGLFDEEME